MASSHPNYIGSVNTFSFRAVSEDGTVLCSNCTSNKDEGALSTAQIVLTVPLYLITTDQRPGIAATGGLRDLQPDSVEAYLTDNLQWRAVSVGLHVLALQRNVPHRQFRTLIRQPADLYFLRFLLSQASGEEILATSLPRTRIFALKGQATHYRNNSRMSAYTGYEPMPRVTSTKAWGASADQY